MTRLKVIAAILAVYGFFMLSGGIVADAFGLPPRAQVGMAVGGFLLLVSAFGLWRQRRWAAVLAVVSLLTISGVVYYNDYLTDGTGQVHWPSHLIRGLVGLVLIVLILRGWRVLK
ncbi:MAG TPA: hypothetical protein VNM72_14265 [Blastocatellia bacterium]|nr:hypothetical protein [Blastocatellia bacterium]